MGSKHFFRGADGEMFSGGERVREVNTTDASWHVSTRLQITKDYKWVH
jgi:hypothetical protein